MSSIESPAETSLNTSELVPYNRSKKARDLFDDILWETELEMALSDGPMLKTSDLVYVLHYWIQPEINRRHYSRKSRTFGVIVRVIGKYTLTLYQRRIFYTFLFSCMDKGLL